MKKILIAINSDIGRENTIGARFAHVARYILDKKEFDLKVIARSNYTDNIDVIFPFYGNLLGRGVKTIKTFFPFLGKKIVSPRKSFDSFVLKKIVGESFDVAHIDSGAPRTLKYLKSKGTKIVIDISMTPWLVSERLKNIHNSANYITAPSPLVEKVLRSSGVEADIAIIPFGVDAKKFKPEFKKENKKIRFVFVGTVFKRKGVDTLIEAWKELNLENAELHFYGRIRRELKGYFRETKKCNIISYGFVDVSKELPKNDVFVLPSLREGSAKAVYEALACGLPIITTPNAGSVIREKEEGFLVPAKDKEAIKEKILYFYNNPEKIREMGKRGRKLAEEYSWKRYSESVYNIYKKVLEEK